MPDVLDLDEMDDGEDKGGEEDPAAVAERVGNEEHELRQQYINYTKKLEKRLNALSIPPSI